MKTVRLAAKEEIDILGEATFKQGDRLKCKLKCTGNDGLFNGLCYCIFCSNTTSSLGHAVSKAILS